MLHYAQDVSVRLIQSIDKNLFQSLPFMNKNTGEWTEKKRQHMKCYDITMAEKKTVKRWNFDDSIHVSNKYESIEHENKMNQSNMNKIHRIRRKNTLWIDFDVQNLTILFDLNPFKPCNEFKDLSVLVAHLAIVILVVYNFVVVCYCYCCCCYFF